jgi:hypothetical protein
VKTAGIPARHFQYSCRTEHSGESEQQKLELITARMAASLLRQQMFNASVAGFIDNTSHMSRLQGVLGMRQKK